VSPLLAFMGLLALMAAASAKDPLPFIIIALIIFMVGSRSAWTTKADA
jgi:hypothetical protein